ncbi:hypothetical protein [Alienimonas californiensis]|uniref:Uncharacterized protein n=1 Tax=Alienimonas californiensis TaxID=2527989 RepID=A0A517PF06_9PLAN|nr:hypothetical protein [Alienimonas californiensis]QDT17957.1 hypothetical protein CA12_40950 [Alienimonas californiensis]
MIRARLLTAAALLLAPCLFAGCGDSVREPSTDPTPVGGESDSGVIDPNNPGYDPNNEV